MKRVDADSLYILSLQSMIDGDYTDFVEYPLDDDRVFPDFCDLTLRFGVGDQVLCKTNNGWEARNVAYLWPIREIKKQEHLDVEPQYPGHYVVPCYKCEDKTSAIAAPFDLDRCIIKHQSSFRFGVGDSVIFSAGLAMATGRSAIQLKNKSSWIQGTVTAIDILGLEYNATYKCVFDGAGKQYSCHVTKDDDEHIARKDADPRSRLFEAIEQDCSRSHLKYLATTSSIDVTTFRDLVITKALDFASYQALSWLQHECSIDVLHFKDKRGNNFLHKIAYSSNAARFIKEAGRVSKICPIPEWTLDMHYTKDLEAAKDDNRLLYLTTALNNNGETWLQILVHRGDSHALDAALSPNVGLAWKFASSYVFGKTDLDSLVEAVKKSKNVIMQCIFDSFILFRACNLQCDEITCILPQTEDDLLQKESMIVFQGDEAPHHAKLLARFITDWQEHCTHERSTLERVCDNIVSNGFSRLFTLLCDADSSLFLNKSYRRWSNEDRNEFIQPELSPINDGSYSTYDCLDVDIAMACIIGCNGNMIQSYDGRYYYFSELKQHALSCYPSSCPSWLSHLRIMTDQKNKCCDRNVDFCKKKIPLLEDDGDLRGRLQILDYLLRCHPSIELNVLEAIKHRQCGVLRFMVDRGLVQIESNASSNSFFMKNITKFQFLDSGCIPSSMSTKCFLCFAAVEYDDLQSLQWICESFGTPAELCDGWNLLHFSAFMGRIEIVVSFYLHPVWQSLIVQECQRKPFQNAYAVHIAAVQGHIILVELLLDMKVSTKDGKGQSIEFYAKKSQHTVAHEWGAERDKEREKPRALERHIKKLLQLAKTKNPHTSSEAMKNLIISSNCLDVEAWLACNYWQFDQKGPMGYSFGEILYECCSNSLNQSFVLWLCTRLYFGNKDEYPYYFWKSNEKAKQEHSTRILKRDDLLSFTADKGYLDLANYLQKRWFDKIECYDPLTRDFLLESSLGEGDILLKIRDKLLRAVVLIKMAVISDEMFRNLITHGGRPNDVDEVLRIGVAVKKYLVDEGYANSSYRYEHREISCYVKPIDMSAYTHYNYPEEHSLFKQLAFCWKSPFELSHVHIVLTTEGFYELLEYCLRNMQGWTADMELDVVRLAAFYGHSSICDLFLKGEGLISDLNCRFRAAMLGLGEACSSRDMIYLLESYGNKCVLVKDERLSGETDFDCRRTYVDQSLVCAILNGYINFLSEKDMKTLKVLVDRLNYSHEDILYAAKIFMLTFRYTRDSIDWMGRFVDLLQSTFEALDLQPMYHQEHIQALCKEIVETFDRELGCNRIYTNDDKAVEKRVLKWLGEMADQGLDIQNVAVDVTKYSYRPRKNDFTVQFLELGKRQLRTWSQFDVIINGGSLKEIQDVIEQGRLSIHARSRGGLMLTHLSSAYDRVDLLEWLVVSKGMYLDSKDGQHRNVLEVAKAAQAASTTKWIVERQAGRTISTFMQRHHHRMLAICKQHRVECAVANIQRNYRGHSIRKVYRGSLLHRLEASQRFQEVWGKVSANRNFSQIAPDWSSIREKVCDMKHTEFMHDGGYFEDTDDQLSKALKGALQMNNNDIISCTSDGEVLPHSVGHSLDIVEGPLDDTASWLTFQMTSHVVKFLKQGDPKYKIFFVRRMQQLASGERSRILQKRLKGSKSTIFETYLEQKSGFRILWTQEGGSIVVWFVAKHKEVSRLMTLIDDSKSRTARQQISQSLISDLQNEDLAHQSTQKDEILLDVFGNIPLKLYEVKFHSIQDIKKDSWTPKLHLTEEERDVVEAEGTVLVLGRSGTGKTVCICNRIEYDRQRYGQDPTFSQLFVARSKRLCKYVSETAGMHEHSSFQTFEEMIRDIDAAMPQLDGNDRRFLPSLRIDFQRFRQEFHDNYAAHEAKEVSALIVWTVIRTYIKGSIQAFQSGGILPRESFTTVEILGKNRCRVPVQLREYVYDEFETYEKFKQDKGLWDDCDRIRDLLLRFEETNRVDSAVLDRVRRSRIYVDEIQDYTQIECLVFFYLGGPSGLFLAGDSAQSVVEGTEFRFEEIRSLGYFVAGSDRHELVPQKPKTVNVNFRSHAGILNTAAAFLDVLFKYFPGSAKQLQKDRGLFQGSRPGVLHNVDTKKLAVLLSDKLKGTVVLVHDESSHYWRRALGDYKLVYGIREAKGLEFKSVILLNFFQELPSSLQKPWRNLLLNREGVDFEVKHPLVGTQLKLLYTGITRCIERLFFVETSSSIAGDAAVRWLTTLTVKKVGPAPGKNEVQETFAEALATRNNITNIESMSMTADEFIGEGFNNAEIAESAELDLEQAHSSLERSIWCFEQGGNHELAAKARAHRQSIQFRLGLVPPHEQQCISDGINGQNLIEVKGAQIMESLISEGLLFEVLNIFYSISPFIPPYVKEELERCFISKIRLTISKK